MVCSLTTFKKEAIFALSFLLLGLPVFVFAQTAPAGSVGVTDTAGNPWSVQPPVNKTPPTASHPSGGSVKGGGFTTNVVGGGSGQTIPVSVKEGAAAGNVVDPNVSSEPGAFTYQYTFSIPPGRNGMSPNVTLSYSSANGSDTGFGYGWGLSIPRRALTELSQEYLYRWALMEKVNLNC